jgi:cell division septation protein DedD
MALYSRGDASSELPESQIEYRNPDSGRRFVSLIIYIVLALVVAALVVLAGRWIYHKVSNNSGPAPTTIAPKDVKQGTTTPNPSPSTKTPAYSNPTPTPPQSSSSGGAQKVTPTPSPTPTPTALPNNGPGQAIALFLGTSFVAAFLHFTFKLRKLAKIS